MILKHNKSPNNITQSIKRLQYETTIASVVRHHKITRKTLSS